MTRHPPPPRPTAVAHSWLAEILATGATAIDATAGNGHDTLFLAGRVGSGGRVLAFDVLPAALAATRARVTAAGLADRVTLLPVSHEHLAEYAAPGTVAAVMFNLGYLPGHNHELTTQTPVTLAALAAAATVLRSGGALAVVCYPGHPEGARETAAVGDWFRRLPGADWQVRDYRIPDTLRPAPELHFARRR